MTRVNSNTGTQDKAIQIFGRIGKALKDMTLIIPLVQLIFDLCFEKWAHRNFIRKLIMPKLSPLAMERLKEKEAKVRDIARRAGIIHPERISVLVSPDQTDYSTYANMIIIAPADLIKKEDLPKDLQLENYDEKTLTGVVKFEQKFTPWLANEFLACKEFKKALQLNALKTLKDETEREKIFLASVGHELGHYFHKHSRKERLARFGLRMFSLPTLGLTSLFEEKLIQKMKRRQEKEADLFSARKLGGAEGLIAYFSQDLALHQMFYKGLPGIKGLIHLYDEKGNYLHDHQHPPLTSRIAYLKPLIGR